MVKCSGRDRRHDLLFEDDDGLSQGATTRMFLTEGVRWSHRDSYKPPHAELSMFTRVLVEEQAFSSVASHSASRIQSSTDCSSWESTASRRWRTVGRYGTQSVASSARAAPAAAQAPWRAVEHRHDPSTLLYPHAAQRLRTRTLSPSMAVTPLYDDAPSLHIFGRDVSSTLTPNPTQRTTLIVAGCYVVAIAILWYA